MQSYFSRVAVVITILLPIKSIAETQAVAKETTYNPVLIALLCLALVFLMAIAMMANTLKQLAFAYWDKLRSDNAKSGVAKAILLLLALSFSVTQLVAQTAPTEVVAPVESPFISGIPRNDFYVIAGLLMVELMVMLVLLYQIMAMVKKLRGIPEKAHVPAKVLGWKIWKVLNKSVALEEEASIVMDHDYDGIHELDNDLPPWWKYGFILTIVVAVLYLGYYHVAGGPNQVDEYNAAVKKGELEKTAYLEKSANNVDENTVTAVMDPGELSNAQNVFQTACAACHLKDGGGNVGPNLTDNYWLHGGTLKDVFKTIKYGWPDKGMKSWKDDYSPKQIAALASYVKSLAGTKPLTPKAPQGELMVIGGDKALDSVSNKTDPSLDPSGKKENKDNPVGPYPAKKK